MVRLPSWLIPNNLINVIWPADMDPYNLDRFLYAQYGVYADVLAEIRSGRKRSHWMWFIFPQLDGLAFSSTSRFYAIKSLVEAAAYLEHPELGPRLLECTDAVLSQRGRSASQVFGHPDDLKLISCMTLFASASEQGSAFEKVLEGFYLGQRDERTLQLLAGSGGKGNMPS